MFRSTLFAAAVLAMLSMDTTSPAIADAPCAQPPCGVRRVVVHRGYSVPRYFVVDRGPVYGGPGIFVNPTIERRRKLALYPYVGRVWPGY